VTGRTGACAVGVDVVLGALDLFPGCNHVTFGTGCPGAS
jgi:hypothetical protein